MKFQEVCIEEVRSCVQETSEARLRLVAPSLLAGLSCGRLWRGDDGSAFVLWDQGNNVFYLAGRELGAPLQQPLHRLFQETIQPQAEAEASVYFCAKALAEEGQTFLSRALAPWVKGQDTKVFYQWPMAHTKYLPAPIVPDVTLVSLDRQCLCGGAVGNTMPVLDEICSMWPSVQAYLDNGWGVGAVRDGQLICWCTAEYVSSDSCGIGIETAASARRQGMATAAAAAFVRRCWDRGIVPHWECWQDNVPSVKIAEKLGFQKLETSEVIVGHF